MVRGRFHYRNALLGVIKDNRFLAAVLIKHADCGVDVIAFQNLKFERLAETLLRNRSVKFDQVPDDIDLASASRGRASDRSFM